MFVVPIYIGLCKILDCNYKDIDVLGGFSLFSGNSWVLVFISGFSFCFELKTHLPSDEFSFKGKKVQISFQHRN